MIQIKNLYFGYIKNRDLFKDLTLDFKPGRIYGLLGKNGTGKTTLLKMMSGLLTPHKGSCTLNEIRAMDRLPETLQEIFIVPEEFSLPVIRMRQYEKINSPFYPNFDHEQFNVYLKEFELPHDSGLNAMSFGQKKKFLLAFGLATNVSMLFLDEPTNGLDIPSKSQFRKTVARAINDDRSIIISTHQVRDLENLIDTIVIIENGTIIFNQGHADITSKLAFDKVRSIDDDPSIFYKEETLGGYRVVRRAKPTEESVLDLELLFNAVVTKHEVIAKQF